MADQIGEGEFIQQWLIFIKNICNVTINKIAH